MPAPNGVETSANPPLPVVLDLEGIQAHYRIGKTRALELVSAPGFVRSVVPGMHRYPQSAVAAYDLAVALAGTVAEPTPATAPIVVTPPGPARPGPKSATAASRKAA